MKYLAIISSIISLFSLIGIGILGWFYMQSNSLFPCREFFNVQYVAHGRYNIDSLADNSLELYRDIIEVKHYKIIETDILFTSDNIPVLSHDDDISLIAYDECGNKIDTYISNTPYSVLCKLYISKPYSENCLDIGKMCKISTLKDLLMMAKRNNVCVQLDMAKQVFGEEKCNILYNMCAEYGMLNRIIWEVNDPDFFCLSKMNQRLTFQFDETWDDKTVDALWKRKIVSGQIILSKGFSNFDNLDYSSFIRHAHSSGFLVKCSTINDKNIADSLFRMGVDMIVTDELLN